MRKLILLALAAAEQFIGHTIDLTGEGYPVCEHVIVV